MIWWGGEVAEPKLFASAKGFVQPQPRSVSRPLLATMTALAGLGWTGTADAQDQNPTPAPAPQATPAPARRQSATPALDQPAAEQGLRIEPSLTALYDDNVYRVDSHKQDPIADVILTPAIEVRYDHDIGVRRVRLRALVGYDQFLKESQRSKPRFTVEGSGRLLVAGRCAVEPLASFREERADYGDINSATENLQRFSVLSVAADCERPAGLYPVAAWRRDTTRNGNGFEYADQTSNLYRGGVGYARPSLGKFALYYEHVDSDRPQLALTNRSDAVGLGFERSVSPLTAIKADLRWMHVTSTSAAVGTYDGPGWSVQLSTTAIPRIKLTAATDRNVVNDSLVATGFVIRTSYRLSAEVGLSELASAGAFAEFANRDLRQDPALRAFSYTHDNTNQYGLFARRKIGRRLALELAASHVDRTTNSDVSNYKANRVSLAATMEF